MSRIVRDAIAGAGEGVLDGLGNLVKGIREAISGKEIVTGQERLAIIEKVSLLENSLLIAESQVNLAQIKLNEAEALSSSGFRGNWRPAIGWVCVLGLFYQLIFQPLLPWILMSSSIVLSHKAIILPELPKLDGQTLFSLISGLLGLGGFRTFEKLRGIK
jgi:hypothetical protein